MRKEHDFLVYIKPYTYLQNDGNFVCKYELEYKDKINEIKTYSKKSENKARDRWIKKAQKWIEEVDRERDIDDGKIKFCVAISEWYELYKEGDGRKNTTIETDRDTIRQLCESDFSSKNVVDIRSRDIQKYLNELSKIKSNSTIKKRYRMLTMFFDHSNLLDMQMICLIIPGS